MDFSELSRNITSSLSKSDKKKDGIFFTPKSTIERVLSSLEGYMSQINNILEPSCGSCEFILQMNEKYSGKNFTGIEFNEQIYDKIKFLNESYDNIEIKNNDFLSYSNEIEYDLAIGNPPYFVMKKNEVDSSYFDYFDGRPNIFVLFIIRALQMLKNGGILSFVVPKSFTNCIYYQKTRIFINKNCKILDIFECNDSYIDTQQSTIVITIQKNIGNINNNNKYILNVNDNIIFGEPSTIDEIRSLYHNSTTLKELNLNVKIGTVVWNQRKDILTDNASNTLLVYNSNIMKNTLVIKDFKNEKKKNYINLKGYTTPCLVINRGNGIGKFNLNYCIIDGSKEYLIENHLICITPKENMETNNLLLLYQKIIDSLKSNKTKKFIELYCGNSALNTNELSNIVPIYDFN